jgi:hypothetical protein
MMRALALAMLALGCQGTSGGVRPDARELDAAVDPCAEPSDWAVREPRLIADHGAPPAALAADDSYVYWTEPLPCGLDGGCLAGPIVRRAALEGGQAEVLFDSDADQAGSLALTRDYLFVSIGDQLWRAQKDGTAPEVVATAAAFVADADAIYYVEGGTLVRQAADTLDVTPLGQAMELGVDLQLAGGAAWWLQPDPADIWRMPLDTGIAELAAEILDTAGSELAVDGLGRAFLATWPQQDPAAAGTLVRVVADAGEPEALADLSDAIVAVAVDEAYVYWMEPNASRLSRMPLDGGCIESRDRDGQGGTAIAVSAEGLLLANGAGSIILVGR